MSDTPRTDAAVAGGVNASHWMEDRDTLVHTSCQLERELSAARRELAEARDGLLTAEARGMRKALSIAEGYLRTNDAISFLRNDIKNAIAAAELERPRVHQGWRLRMRRAEQEGRGVSLCGQRTASTSLLCFAAQSL